MAHMTEFRRGNIGFKICSKSELCFSPSFVKTQPLFYRKAAKYNYFIIQTCLQTKQFYEKIG